MAVDQKGLDDGNQQEYTIPPHGIIWLKWSFAKLVLHVSLFLYS